MTKKLIALVCVLTLVFAALPAGAADAPLSAVYRLVSRDAAGEDTLLGCALLLGDEYTLVTTVAAASAYGGLYAVGDDGEHAIRRGLRVPGSELVTLTLASPSSASPLTISTDGGVYAVLGCGAEGVVTLSVGQEASVVRYAGENCTAISAREGLLPGCAVVDEQMRVTGMVAASCGEGVGRYAVLPAEMLPMTGDGEEFDLGRDDATMEDFLTEETETVWLRDVALTQDGAVLTADWSASPVADMRDDSVFAVFLMDLENTYYSYVQVSGDQSRCAFPASPGRTYLVCVQHAHGEAVTDVVFPEDAVTYITMNHAPMFDRYDYQTTELYLGVLAAEGAEDAALAQPLEEITAEALMAEDIDVYLQAVSSYEVSETAESELLGVLTTPEGYAFTVSGGFVFDPTLAQEDAWHLPVSPMLDDYLTFCGSIASGTYVLTYYFDGEMAGSISFEVQ